MRTRFAILILLMVPAAVAGGTGLSLAIDSPVWPFGGGPEQRAIQQQPGDLGAQPASDQSFPLVLPSPDPDIHFPAALSNLPESPFDLAIDRLTGDLWFPLFPFQADGSVRPKLYHYRPADGSVESFDLPSGGGSGLFSAIEVDQRGHVIVGYGYTVVDFDPVSLALASHDLPVAPRNYADNSSEPSTALTDMTVDAAGRLFIGRFDTAAVSELSLQSGETTEHAIPFSFGPPTALEAASDGIYMTNWIGFGQARQIATFNPDSGEFLTLGAQAFDLAANPAGGVLATSIAGPALLGVSASGISSHYSAALRSHLSGSSDYVAVDGGTGVIWVAGEGTGVITRWNPADDSTRIYSLPWNVVPASQIRCPYPGTCQDQRVATVVSGMVVDQSGNLYFSDKTAKRVGFIPTP